MPATTHAPTTTIPRIDTRKPSLPRRLVLWLIRRDRHFRDTRKLRAMPDERLVDMGLSRADIESLS